ncbi:hypothetical protein DBR11_05005 [Pedobacter sp. HMWF019]|uniref:DUF6283 family protein n=1 Tax=Pedobacter sp. HMWF019 TaxID=2056856 RepID=UPI000D3963F1|nr:DUF6283 family protein [Pedobacter sp. HMWF019]PTT02349.1 hypothetical protein DBR11_05005 [Pedobacter sp. HMWF019]
MSEKFKLKFTKQCAKCPWKVGIKPEDLPGQYSKQLHQDLASTIADPNPINYNPDQEREVMGCHKSPSDFCIGYLHNQLGEGHNLALRVEFINCENLKDLKVVGPQHAAFEDILQPDNHVSEK